jgi:hypothetical protein
MPGGEAPGPSKDCRHPITGGANTILGASRFDLCVTQCTPTGRSHHNQRASGVDRPFFDVAAVEQVLVNGASDWPMDDALALGVVPEKIALVVRQFAHNIIVQNADATSKT